jgi:hypothetical protein
VSDAPKPSKPCLYCGEPFFRKRHHDTKRWAKARWCSKSCWARDRHQREGGEHMRSLKEKRVAWLTVPENAARMLQRQRENLAGQQPKAIAAIKRKWLGWCPLSFRETYRVFTQVKRYPAPVARKLVEDLIEVERRKAGETVRAAQASMVERHRREVASRY